MPYFLGLGAYLILLLNFGLSELFEAGSVFVPHDTFYPISDAIWQISFSIFNGAFNYSNNLPALMVLTPDAVIIGILKILFSNGICQIIHIFACLIIFYSFSFFSINKIYQKPKLSAILTLCYCFSPYSAVLYSAGIIYQISTVVALGILPLFLFRLICFEQRYIDSLITMTTLLAFGLLFIYPALLLIFLAIFIFYKQKKLRGLRVILNKLLTLKRVGGIALLSLPFIFFIFLTVIIGNDNVAILSGGTNTAIKGGIFFPLMQISAWGLYDIWSPRAILSFHHYFFENPYRILSIALVTLFIYFLFKNKKYVPIIFLLFLAFFAKGPNQPFGELFTFIINYFPFGYMIRSPDSKFGAFIAAWFIVSVYLLHPKQKLVIIALAILFLTFNLTGIFANGAISSFKGDSKTTTFIRDQEAKIVTELINTHSNSVVIGNFPSCTGEWYENKFHTCHGLISTSTDRQFIPIDGISLVKNIEKFKSFPMLILINKRQGEAELSNALQEALTTFPVIYDSENYKLYFQETAFKACSGRFMFSCIKNEDQYLITLPETAFQYYYPRTPYKILNGIVSVASEPDLKQDYKKIIFIWLYSIIYLYCLWAVLTAVNKHRH